MDISNLDPALLGLLGVVVGSVLSLIGNFLAQWITLRREERQWERQRKAEKEDLELQERKIEIERVRNIYNNCISQLSLMASYANGEEKLTDDELIKLRRESHEWVTKLKLHQRDLYSNPRSTFHVRVNDFTRAPDEWAASLLSEINKLSVNDKLLFPEVATTNEDADERSVQISVSDNYRRQQIINGVEIPRNHVFRCSLSELSNKQREIL